MLHEARNTTASLLLAAKVDPFIITQILGHTNITTSQGYMRVAESQKRKAIEQVAELLGLECGLDGVSFAPDIVKNE